MATTRDVVIIGGGHNGLVAAFYLARAGLKPLVVERRPVVGGVAVTEEIYPGFKCSALAHTCGPLLPEIVRDLQLERNGLRIIQSAVRVFAPSPDGRALILRDDPAEAAKEISIFSKKDAENFLEFHQVLGRLAKFLQPWLLETPPELNSTQPGDIWDLLPAGARLVGLKNKDLFRLLRWAPMAVADLVDEWFETEFLRAAVAARGIFGTFLGPRSAGSGAVLLTRAAADPHPAGTAIFPAGGMGALAQAMAKAATQAGAEIRTGAEVSDIRIKDGKATGVVLADGEEIPAKLVVSNADPKRTFLRLIDPAHLAPNFLVKIQNYRCRGCVAKVNLALSALPTFVALKKLGGSVEENLHSLAGRIHIGPEMDYLERAFDAAKYGEFSQQPFLDITIPSLTDPTLAPAGQHVMSICVQFAPFKLKQGDWHEQREALSDAVIRTLCPYAPDLPSLILHRQVLTPRDLEENYGLTGGDIFHGELGLDQLFAMRPLFGWARYRTPLQGLYLCGSGTHPGTGLTGASGHNAAREIVKDWKKLKRAYAAQGRASNPPLRISR